MKTTNCPGHAVDLKTLMQVGNKIHINLLPPLKWWERLLWRAFKIHIDRKPEPKELTVTHVTPDGVSWDRSGWQPIETAPTDGTEVDLYGLDWGGYARRVAGAKWGEIDGKWCWAVYDVRQGEGGDWCIDLKTPTHWMPVPPPPQMTTTQLKSHE